ncbi:MAG: DUF6691 family protein [bacterium]
MATQKIVRKKTSRVASKKLKLKMPAQSTASAGWLLIFGILFGYFLSKSRATDFDTVLNMFLFKDFQLYGVIVVAVVVIALGLFILRHKSKAFAGKVENWDNPPVDRKRLIGAFIFGAGWALAGVCPGTVFTQLGEGKCSAIFPLVGLWAGVWVFLRFGPKFKKK